MDAVSVPRAWRRRGIPLRWKSRGIPTCAPRLDSSQTRAPPSPARELCRDGGLVSSSFHSAGAHRPMGRPRPPSAAGGSQGRRSARSPPGSKRMSPRTGRSETGVRPAGGGVWVSNVLISGCSRGRCRPLSRSGAAGSRSGFHRRARSGGVAGCLRPARLAACAARNPARAAGLRPVRAGACERGRIRPALCRWFCRCPYFREDEVRSGSVRRNMHVTFGHDGHGGARPAPDRSCHARRSRNTGAKLHISINHGRRRVPIPAPRDGRARPSAGTRLPGPTGTGWPAGIRVPGGSAPLRGPGANPAGPQTGRWGRGRHDRERAGPARSRPRPSSSRPGLCVQTEVSRASARPIRPCAPDRPLEKGPFVWPFSRCADMFDRWRRRCGVGPMGGLVGLCLRRGLLARRCPARPGSPWPCPSPCRGPRPCRCSAGGVRGRAHRPRRSGTGCTCSDRPRRPSRCAGPAPPPPRGGSEMFSM